MSSGRTSRLTLRLALWFRGGLATTAIVTSPGSRSTDLVGGCGHVRVHCRIAAPAMPASISPGEYAFHAPGGSSGQGHLRAMHSSLVAVIRCSSSMPTSWTSTGYLVYLGMFRISMPPCALCLGFLRGLRGRRRPPQHYGKHRTSQLQLASPIMSGHVRQGRTWPSELGHVDRHASVASPAPIRSTAWRAAKATRTPQGAGRPMDSHMASGDSLRVGGRHIRASPRSLPALG